MLEPRQRRRQAWGLLRRVPPLPHPAGAAWLRRLLRHGHSHLLQRHLPRCRRTTACCLHPAPRPGPGQPPLAPPRAGRPCQRLLHSGVAPQAGRRRQRQLPAAVEGNSQPQAVVRRQRQRQEAAGSKLAPRLWPPEVMWAADGPRTGP